MIKEAYVSFEVAKLLKEKGFEGDINAYYHIWDNGNKVCSVQEFSHSEAPHLYIPAPTHQTAMRWLREVHGIYIVFFHTNKSGWWYNITDMIDSYVFYSSEKIMCSYEEVVDLAIKYTLKNLI